MNAIGVEGDHLDQPVEVIVNAWNRHDSSNAFEDRKGRSN
jgi:hypothetical protein